MEIVPARVWPMEHSLGVLYGHDDLCFTLYFRYMNGEGPYGYHETLDAGNEKARGIARHLGLC